MATAFEMAIDLTPTPTAATTKTAILVYYKGTQRDSGNMVPCAIRT